jgi:preprotein translocase subunit SecD
VASVILSCGHRAFRALSAENVEETFPVAPPPGTLRVGRYFAALLALLAVLYAIVFFPGNRHKPKLGIDLVGGLRVVFTALTPPGTPSPTSSQLTQARQILEDRINGTGVTGSTVVVQGNNQLVVEIPNGTGTDVARLGKAAVLNFRGLMAPATAVSCGASAPANNGTSTGSATGTPTGTASSGANTSKSAGASHAPHDAGAQRLTAPTTSAKPSGTAKAKATPSTTPTASATPTSGAAASTKCLADPIGLVLKADPSLKAKMPNSEVCPSPGIPDSQCKAYSALSSTQKQELTAALQHYKCSAAQIEPDKINRYYVACDTSGQIAYLLGHVVVPGRHISSASAQAPNVGGTGGSAEWTVNLTLNGAGANSWNGWTSKYNTGGSNPSSASPLQCGGSGSTPCSDYVGFTLDGQVISAPITLAALDRNTQISGSFTQSSAKQLAKELNYGKLPVSFRSDDQLNVSATLGNTQLKAAFLAGGIGLALVIIYSLLYYRALGLITIASLVVSAALTYAMLVILSKQIGFTLDLSGIAGFIVALGITADSFVVFFERIKDEVHEGRSLRVAVPRAWVRARRTILSADTVSFLAAAILYYFASADVKGFAFTLGMSTILDLVVVFLFTHPMISSLSRLRAFGSPKFTGLSSVRVGGIATSDEEPRVRRTRPSRARTTREQQPDQAAAVAVLEAEEDEAPDAVAVDAEPDEGQPRRRATPEPGTAAERAAARRARMRGEGDGKGER